MPKLAQSLSKYDLGFLRNLAQLWGCNYPLKNKKTAIEQLTVWMTDSQNIPRVLDHLQSDARNALEELIEHQGWIPSAVFRRKYGEIRQVGAGKRDREAILLSPQNASERLYFQGLIFQDFFEGEQGLEEYIYIPSDLFAAIPILPSCKSKTSQFEALLSNEKIEQICSVADYLYDDLCTCLAWLRIDKRTPKEFHVLQKHLLISKEHLKCLPFSIRPEFLVTLLTDAGILDSSSSLLPEAARNFLSLPRGEAIRLFFEIWLKSSTINELKQLEQLECLGEWENDPIAVRRFIIDRLNSLKSDVWYDLDLFIKHILDYFPDFQRPGGNYDVWLIRRRTDGVFLQGFESWPFVEGELLRYLITGPLLWFGILEFGSIKQSPSSYAFRITKPGSLLLQHQPLTDLVEPEEKVQVFPSGTLSVPRRISASVRYQIARFCEWETYHNEHFYYRITSKSLQHAQQKNLKPTQLLRLLQKHGENLPPTLILALRRWVAHGTEITIQPLTVLRVRSPEILDKIKKSRNAKYLQHILNPTTAVVATGREKTIVEQLLTMGYFVDVEKDILSKEIHFDKEG